MADKAPSEPLTPRQREVLQRLADGQRISDIAVGIGCGPKCITTEVGKILQSLGADNAKHAIAQGFRAGLIQ